MKMEGMEGEYLAILQSLPTRERGLKSGCLVVAVSISGRSLCGSVD